ncbi:MAG: Rpn family recombination-promoting nuclease/putative transposase [Roseivirga sp.]
MKKLTSPHDLFLKATLSSPQAMRDFFQAHLPADVLARIDLSTMQLTQASYVSAELKALHNDLVFTCQIDGKKGYLYLLMEHQSTPDWLLPLRLIKYDIALLEDALKGKEAGTPFPVIFNVCLYHGKGPYPYSVKVYDYFSAPHLAEGIGMFTRFHLVDLHRFSDEELERHGSVSVMEKLMKYSRERDFWHQLEGELERSKEWLIGVVGEMELGSEYWATVLLYASSVLERGRRSEEELLTLFSEKLSKSKQELMQTIGQQIERRVTSQLKRRLEKEVREDALQKGMQEGMQQGMQKGMQQVAKSMFSELHLDIDTIKKVTGLTREELERLQQEAAKKA